MGIFKLGASAAASEFYGWVQVGIDVYILHFTYEAKPNSSSWFSAASSDRLVIIAKGFLKLPNLHKLVNQKSPFFLRNLAVRTFSKLLIVFSTKVNLLYLLNSKDSRCCLLHLIKQNYLLKTFLRTLILITLVSLYLETNLKLQNISITPKTVKKVITNLDSSKASGPDCIPVVGLNTCEPELSDIVAELFNTCLKESCFPDCWKVLVVPVF